MATISNPKIAILDSFILKSLFVIKVARVVDIKLDFKVWFFNNWIILSK